eukprot:scaffold199844_cov40-Attheya_sp.AAC.1
MGTNVKRPSWNRSKSGWEKTLLLSSLRNPQPLTWDQDPHQRNLWPRTSRRAVSHDLIHLNCFTSWPQLVPDR